MSPKFSGVIVFALTGALLISASAFAQGAPQGDAGAGRDSGSAASDAGASDAGASDAGAPPAAQPPAAQSPAAQPPAAQPPHAGSGGPTAHPQPRNIAPNSPAGLAEVHQILLTCDHSSPADILVRLNRGSDQGLGKTVVVHFTKQPTAVTVTRWVSPTSQWDYFEAPYSTDLSNESRTLTVHAIGLGQLQGQHTTANCVAALTRFGARAELESATQHPSTAGQQGDAGFTRTSPAGRPVEAPSAAPQKPAGGAPAGSAQPKG